MELDDCAFPLLAGVEIGDDPNQIFSRASTWPAWSAPGRGAKGWSG
jgi:hypothetical protein